MGRTFELRTHLTYGRRLEPNPAADPTADPAAAHAAWVEEQKRRSAVAGAKDVDADDPRWQRLRFFEQLAVGVTEKVAAGVRARHGVQVRVTLNGEELEVARARIRLRLAPMRPDDVQRVRFVRRAMKVLTRVTVAFRPEAVVALTMFRQLVEEAKPGLTRADLLNLQDAFDDALSKFHVKHGALTVEEMRGTVPE